MQKAHVWTCYFFAESVAAWCIGDIAFVVAVVVFVFVVV
jgi:hypothetical protein